MNRPSAGIIWMISTARMKLRRPLNRNRDSASAARNANSSAATTVSPVTIALIRSVSKKLLSNTRPYADTVPFSGTNDGSAERMRLYGRKELFSIQ